MAWDRGLYKCHILLSGLSTCLPAEHEERRRGGGICGRWLGDWPVTGHNVNVIMQWVVSAKQSDWMMVRSRHGDNSHEAQLTMFDQEMQVANSRCKNIGSAMDPTIFFHISTTLSFHCGFPFFLSSLPPSKHGETCVAHVFDSIIWVTDQARVCAAYVKP